MTCELIDFQWHPPIVPAGAVQSDLLSFGLRDQKPPPSPTSHHRHGFERMDVWMDRQKDGNSENTFPPCMSLALYWSTALWSDVVSDINY